MKLALIILALVLIDPGKIGKINQLKSEAKEAFQRGDYATAAARYRQLSDSLGVSEDALRMDLAHSYFHLNDTTAALKTYSSLLNSTNRKYRSIAELQLGVMANRQKKHEEALHHFKEALRHDPSNEEARYNYELLKKKLDDQKKQEQQQNKDQKNQDNKEKKDNKDQQDKQDQQDKKDQQQKDKEKEQQEKEQQEKEKKEQEKKQQEEKEKQNKENKEQKDKKDQPSSEKMKDMKISEEKAKMVLEAMKNQEVQYLQQNKRKATKPKGKGKPDW